MHVFLFQLKRYRELKELVHQQGAGLSQQAEKMNWEVRSDHEKIVFDQRRKKELEVRSIPVKSSPKELNDKFSPRADVALKLLVMTIIKRPF